MRPLVLQLHGICVVSLKNTELAFQKKIIIYSNQQNKSQTTLLTAAACWRLGKGGGDRAERQGEGTLQLAVRQGTRPHHVLPALSEGGLLSVSWSGCLRNHLKRERDREREGGGRERDREAERLTTQKCQLLERRGRGPQDLLPPHLSGSLGKSKGVWGTIGAKGFAQDTLCAPTAEHAGNGWLLSFPFCFNQEHSRSAKPLPPFASTPSSCSSSS